MDLCNRCLGHHRPQGKDDGSDDMLMSMMRMTMTMVALMTTMMMMMMVRCMKHRRSPGTEEGSYRPLPSNHPLLTQSQLLR